MDDIRKRYYKSVNCPECGYRNKGFYVLDLIDGPQDRECVRTQEGRGLCGARWSIAATEERIESMKEFIRVHEIYQVSKAEFERMEKEIYP